MHSQPAVSSRCTLSSVGLSLAPNRPLSAKGLPLGSQACTTTGVTWRKVTAYEPSPSPTLPNPEAPVEFPSPTCAESAWGPPAESQAPGLSQPFSYIAEASSHLQSQKSIFKGLSVKRKSLVCVCKCELSRQREERKREW